MDKHVIKQIKK